MTTLSRGRFTQALAGIAAGVAFPHALRAETNVPVQMAITPVYYDAAPILYANKTGMFPKAGIDLTLGRLPTGSAITAAVAGGSLNVGKSSIFAVVAAFAHGVPIVVIAPGAVYDSRTPNSALVVPKDSPIRTAADLTGKIISVNNLSEPTRPATELWLQRNNVPKDAAKFVEVPMSAMMAALDNHRVDLALLTAPVYDEAMATNKYRVVYPVWSEIAPRWLFSAYIAGREWAKNNRDTVRRFQSVVQAAAAYTNAHHVELAGQLAELEGATESSLAHMTWPMGGTTLLASELQPVIDLAVKAGMIEKSFSANEMIFDPRKA